MNRLLVLVIALGALCHPFARALAQDAPACSRLQRENLVPCVLTASLAVRSEAEEWEAARGRETVSSTILPSNPVLSFSGARRTNDSTSANNWYITLEQELEIAGQRGARRDAAAASRKAQSQRVVLSRRKAAEQAWLAFFDVLAAAEERRLALRLSEIAERVSAVARARAERGLGAPVEADVAAATAVAALTAQMAAERRSRQNEAVLASMLGFDPSTTQLTIEGDLQPLDGVSDALARYSPASLAERPEVLAANAEARAQERRADAFRRNRIPSPTLSLFAQNDGFNERVFGAGIRLPIPLPGNVGQTYRGEIAEAEALTRKARTDREQVEREIRLEVARAADTFESAQRTVDLFSNEQLARAQESLESLTSEVEAGRLAVRDAIVSQQVLVELLSAHVAARKQWCVASVELAHALGLDLEGSAQ